MYSIFKNGFGQEVVRGDLKEALEEVSRRKTTPLPWGNTVNERLTEKRFEMAQLLRRIVLGADLTECENEAWRLLDYIAGTKEWNP